MNDFNNIVIIYDVNNFLGGNDFVVDMLKLRNDILIFKEGKFEDFLKFLILNFGVDFQGVKNFVEN